MLTVKQGVFIVLKYHFESLLCSTFGNKFAELLVSLSVNKNKPS